MCSKIHLKTLIAAAITLSLTAFASAAPRVLYQAVPKSSSVKVAGTSTLHDWTVKSKQIQGTASFPGRWNNQKQLRPVLQIKTGQPQFDAIIPVKSLTSGESGMDSTMFDAMNKSKYPKIAYDLTSATLKKVDTKHHKYYFNTKGTLTIHGVTKPISMVFIVSPLTNGHIAIWGRTDLKMTQFKITPPTAMLGMIKSGNKVTVTVNWLLQRATPKAKAPTTPASAAARQKISAALNAYETVRQDLAKNDAAAAAKDLKAMSKSVAALGQTKSGVANAAQNWTTQTQNLDKATTAAQTKTSLPQLRTAFAAVSTALTQMVGQFGHAQPQPVLVYRGQNSNHEWLQSGSAVRCPYGPAGQIQLMRICLASGKTATAKAAHE